MSVGYGGLDNFDADAAAQNLADVGKDYQSLVDQQQAGVAPVDAVSGGAPIEAPPPSGPELIQPDFEQSGAPTPTVAAPTPSPAAPGATSFDLPPPPPPPELTNDPQQNVANNVEWQRKLAAYHEAATKQAADLNTRTSGIQNQKIIRETAAQKAQLEARQKEAAQYEQVRAQRQAAIDEAIKERAAARKGLEGGNDEQHLHGMKLVAAIAGAIGASLQAYGSAQLGHPQQFENHALKAIDAIEKRKYDLKKQRLASASDSLLEARYGHKEAIDNHRAALNDLDAQMAAEYKLAALEADGQLAKLGYDKAQRDANEVVIKLREGQAKHEGEIHQREEQQDSQRKQAAATLKLAQASLGERRGEHRDALDERKREFDLRKSEADAKLAEKKAAAQEKADADLEKRAIRDPDTDEVIRYAPTPRGVAAVVDKQTASRAYSQGLRELAEDIEKNGRVGSDLPIIGTEAGKRRIELHSNVVARGRKALDLGVSNANLQLEHGAVGGSGAGLSRIGSPEVLRKIADDNDKFAAQRLRSGTAPAHKAAPAAAPAQAAPASNGKPPQKVIDQAWKAVDDKNASPALRQKAVDVLSAAGLL